jgi:hypothetical protein
MFMFSKWCFRVTNRTNQRIAWEICMPLIILSMAVVYYLKDFIDEQIFSILQYNVDIRQKYKNNTWYIRSLTYGICVSAVTMLLGIIIKNMGMYVLPATPVSRPITVPSLASALRPPLQRMRPRM